MTTNIEALKAAEKDGDSGCFEDVETGEKHDYPINAYLIGKLLLNLETTREVMGHTNLKSPLAYIHGKVRGMAEFKFIEELFLRENRGRVRRPGDEQDKDRVG